MVETRINIKKYIGFSLLSLGLGGLFYIAWIYLVWANTLPRFTGTQVFAESTAPEYTFGDVLGNGSAGDVAGVIQEGEEQISMDESLVSDGLTLKERELLGSNTASGGQVAGINNSEIRLDVPRLGISGARVQLDVNGSDERIYDTILTYAVAHLAYSAYPGAFGNTFLFGHSKLPILAGSDYESIFTSLPKVKVGDVVAIHVGNKKYTYQIGQTGVVNPSDVFVMNQPESKQMLTLMTCIPPGFANQRYIAVGELIRVD